MGGYPSILHITNVSVIDFLVKIITNVPENAFFTDYISISSFTVIIYAYILNMIELQNFLM